MLVLGNESGGPHHMQGCHTRAYGLVTEASGFDFEYTSNIHLRLLIFFIY